MTRQSGFLFGIGAVAVAAVAMLAPPSARAAEPYEINVILPLTGPAAFLGNGEKTSLELAEKAMNAKGGIDGRPVKFVIQDDGTSPQTGVQLANQAMAKKPAILLGSSLVAICRAMAPLMENGPVNYCFSPGIHPDAGSYVFTSSVSTLDLAHSLLNYYRLKGWHKLALMFSSDATGQDAENGVKSVLAKPEFKDMQVVDTEHFNTTDLSVSAQIAHIKASGAQAMVAWSTGSPIATIFRGITQEGLDIPVATTDGNMTYAQMTQYKDFLPKQLYIPAAQWVVRDPALLAPALREPHEVFYKSFAAAGVKPDIASELAWDTAWIVVDSLRQIGPNATAKQLRDYMTKLRGFAGVNGVYDFTKTPQRGLDVADSVVTRWSPDKGTWEVVSKPTGIPLP
ncbi:MAG: ABC transporter substrate-binding protein [Alphaproteobacteria bacterium]|nr:ABC transporter substrate-binding protein [Alphaproteobacteria bacterium]